MVLCYPIKLKASFLLLPQIPTAIILLPESPCAFLDSSLPVLSCGIPCHLRGAAWAE